MTDFNTGPRVVPDVAGRDVSGARPSPRGSLHAHRSTPGYHTTGVDLGTFLRSLWARWARIRDRHGD